MSKKAEWIMKRYEKCYITDEQLKHYLELSAITQEEYNAIYAIRHSVE